MCLLFSFIVPQLSVCVCYRQTSSPPLMALGKNPRALGPKNLGVNPYTSIYQPVHKASYLSRVLQRNE